MNLSLRRWLRSTPVLLTLSAMSLSACATNSDRERPPRGGDRQDRPARTSGTFVQPVALLLAEMDSNKDRETTTAELLAGVAAEWKTFDRNPSAITFATWSQRVLGSTDANPTFMSFDRDFNGMITQAEFSAQFDAVFKAMDKNGDGAINRTEMIVAFEAPQGRAQQGGERRERGGGERGGRGGGRPSR